MLISRIGPPVRTFKEIAIDPERISTFNSVTKKLLHYHKSVFPADCATTRKTGVTASGIYSIDPGGKGPMNVYTSFSGAPRGALTIL